MVKKRRTQDSRYRKIAEERIRILFSLAGKARDKDRARGHVALARKIGMRYNVKVPPALRRKACRKCNSYLVPGKTSRIRVSPSKGAVIIKCLKCNNTMRYPYRRVK